MSERLLSQFVGRQVENKFRGHDKLNAKYIPQIPESPEREYIRAANAYMRIVKDVLQEELPTIKQAYMEEWKRADSKGIHFDSMTSLISVVNRTFERMELLIVEKQKSYGLRKILQDISDLTGKLTVKEWKRTVQATLGIDILEDYYKGDFFENALKEWTSENVELITKIPLDTLSQMKEIVLEGYASGQPTTAMMKQMQREYGISKRHSNLIARDQIAKLNSRVAQAQQRDAGIEEYIWDAVRDGRTRKDHKRLHGKTFRWDNPPVVDEKSGRRAHPGEDYQCRCIARPVFKRGNISVPIKEVSTD